MSDIERSVSETVEDAISRDVKDDKTTVIEIRDASTETAKTLVPQMGSDREKLERGKIDWRRFTNLPEAVVIPMAWFMNKREFEGGNWLKNFFEIYGNLRYSIDGEHKKILVGFQKAISGARDDKRKQDPRSWVEKHVTKRGQEPKDELYDV